MELAERILKAKRVYVIGNGGSHANADHICNDLLSCGIKAYTLNSAFLTATANDRGWYKVFERWISIVGEKGDLLIALSGSGKSPNILIACEEAERIGMDVERVFGAPRFDMQAAEEHQIFIGHELMRKLRDRS